MDKTHVVLNGEQKIVWFADFETCAVNKGDNVILAAAIWVKEIELETGESVAIYRHLSGDYLFAIDGSWLEQECEDGLAFDPLDGKMIFLLDSMDPAPDGTMKV